MESTKLSSINNYLRANTFKNKHIIITGATGAIGSEVLKKFLLCGAKIVGLVHSMNKVSSEFNHFFLWYTINTNLVQTTLNGCPLYSELISLLLSFLLFSLFATQETK